MNLIREDIKELNDGCFKYLLKSALFKMLKNKEFSLSLDDIFYKIDDEDIYKGHKEKKKEKLKKQNEFIINFIKNDNKDKESDDEINIMYTAFPIFIDDDSPNSMLRFELLAIAELNDKYGFNKYSYLFCNDLDYLKIISKSTIRFGKTVEDDI